MTAAPPAAEVIRGEYAGIVTRAVALLADIVIISAVVVGVSVSSQLLLDFMLARFSLSDGANDLIQQARTLGLVLFTLWLPPLYDILFWALIGQTPGKMLLGVRVVRTDGRPLTLKVAIVRYLGYFLSVFLLLGFAWVLVDNRRQGWHDKLARTVVIYVWNAQQGQAFRRLRRARARVRAPARPQPPTA